MEEYFYNNTQRGFCETRIINQTLSLRFVGSDPMVFKPGMPFEAQVAVRYHDQVRRLRFKNLILNLSFGQDKKQIFMPFSSLFV